MKYVKLFEDFVSGPICEATVEMDAINPQDPDFLKFLKSNRVKITNMEKKGPSGVPVITMQGKRKDLEAVLADGEYGWDDADLAEYIEESAVNEKLDAKALAQKVMKQLDTFAQLHSQYQPKEVLDTIEGVLKKYKSLYGGKLIQKVGSEIRAELGETGNLANDAYRHIKDIDHIIMGALDESYTEMDINTGGGFFRNILDAEQVKTEEDAIDLFDEGVYMLQKLYKLTEREALEVMNSYMGRKAADQIVDGSATSAVLGLEQYYGRKLKSEFAKVQRAMVSEGADEALVDYEKDDAEYDKMYKDYKYKKKGKKKVNEESEDGYALRTIIGQDIGGDTATDFLANNNVSIDKIRMALRNKSFTKYDLRDVITDKAAKSIERKVMREITESTINEDLRTDLKKYIKKNKKELDQLADADEWESIYQMLINDFRVDPNGEDAEELKTIFNIVY